MSVLSEFGYVWVSIIRTLGYWSHFSVKKKLKIVLAHLQASIKAYLDMVSLLASLEVAIGRPGKVRSGG